MFKVFSIFNTFAMTRYILPIVLMVNVSTVFAEPIYTPSTQKGELIAPSQGAGELSYSGLECWEFCLKYFNDSEFVSRPLGWHWIETNKLGENSGSELGASSHTSSLTLTPVGETMGNEEGEASANSGEQPEGGGAEIDSENVHPFILVWLAITVYSFFGCT
ncbi:MAG: hypothetical protein RL571_2700 [Pseudomonadota bacterium]|jgi:hypothetical protein